MKKKKSYKSQTGNLIWGKTDFARTDFEPGKASLNNVSNQLNYAESVTHSPENATLVV